MGWIATSVLGGLLVVAGLWDAVTTTVNVNERIGHVARAVFAVTHRPLSALLRGGARSSAALLQVVVLILTWLALLWLGWWLVLLGRPAAFAHSATGEAAGAADTLYVAGYGLFALGVGDIAPTTTAAQVLVVLSSATGLILITLVVTYLLMLTRAATHKRHVARLVRSLGDGPEEIVRHAWDGSSFQPAIPPLQDIARELAMVAEHQVTFPVLYEFGTHRPELTLGGRLVDILDAIHLMRAAAPQARIPEVSSHQLRVGMAELVRAVPLLDEVDELAPEPGVGVLDQLGVPVTDGEVDTHLDAALRRELHALAMLEGWPKTEDRPSA